MARTETEIPVMLPPGLPTVEVYQLLARDPLFLDMQTFSRCFLDANKNVLAGYSSRWARDPMSWWSRGWEYYFVYERVKEACEAKKSRALILDAGSGITFFPYFVASTLDNVTVDCCDIDPSWETAFGCINRTSSYYANFHLADIQKLPFRSDSRDLIYCISVVEHCKNHEEIIQEFHRVLKSRGLLVLTFDVSIDSLTELSLKKVLRLLNSLQRYFCFDDIDIKQFATLLADEGRLLDSGTVLKADQQAGTLKNILRILSGKRLSLGRNNLTVCCLAGRKQ